MKPINPDYPEELNTLGDHLRKARLDRGLSQFDVGRMLDATTDSVTGWELNRFSPRPKHAKAIIEFLGYFPFSEGSHTLGKRLYYARLIDGKTQREAAKEIGCDSTSVYFIEHDQRNPLPEMRTKIQWFIDKAVASLSGVGSTELQEGWWGGAEKIFPIYPAGSC